MEILHLAGLRMINYIVRNSSKQFCRSSYLELKVWVAQWRESNNFLDQVDNVASRVLEIRKEKNAKIHREEYYNNLTNINNLRNEGRNHRDRHICPSHLLEFVWATSVLIFVSFCHVVLLWMHLRHFDAVRSRFSDDLLGLTWTWV